jgi:small subunit ribosomal protein S2
MIEIKQKELLDAGVHFGHLTRKWNPKMAPFILMERNGIHLIDLNKTKKSLEIVGEALRNIARSGKKIMFVATKKQAQEIVSSEAKRLKMPFVTERWLGGMLTNFVTVRKSLKKLSTIDKLMKDEEFQNLAKKERLMKMREKEKLTRVLGGIEEIQRIPAALFIVDIRKEHIAVAEAQKLNIPVFAMVDTNSDPDKVDFAIPSNDDAFKSINLIVKILSSYIEDGLDERKKEKEEAKKKESDEQEAIEALEAKKAEEALEAKQTEEKKDAAEAKKEDAPEAKKEETPEEKKEDAPEAKKENSPEKKEKAEQE